MNMWASHNPTARTPFAPLPSEPEKQRQGAPETPCTICGQPITGAFIGDGDGSGQRFAHADCYHEREAKGRAELDKNDAAKAQEGRYIEHGPELAAACEAVHHQLAHGEASDGDLRDIAWCADTLRAALAKVKP